MDRSAQLTMSFLLTLLACTAQGQEPASPPSGAFPGTDLATTMKALEEQLRSIAGDMHSYQFSQVELQRTSADANDCVLHVPLRNRVNTGIYRPHNIVLNPHGEYYLEEVSAVESHDVADSRAEGNKPLYYVSENIQGRLDFGFGEFTFYFLSRAKAEEVAALIRKAADACRARPAFLQASAGPSLAETLKFIVDKINFEGRITWTSDYTNPPSTTTSYEQTASLPERGTCTILISKRFGSQIQGGSLLSLRRVAKVELLPAPDAQNRFEDKFQAEIQSHNPSFPVKRNPVTRTSPPIFVLRITTPAGGWRDLIFSDETLADRVAKAMVHAAELCGAGSKPEVF
jgi:hypothetical protein